MHFFSSVRDINMVCSVCVVTGVPVSSRVSAKIQQLVNTLKQPRRPPLREFFVDDFDELLEGENLPHDRLCGFIRSVFLRTPRVVCRISLAPGDVSNCCMLTVSQSAPLTDLLSLTCTERKAEAAW